MAFDKGQTVGLFIAGTLVGVAIGLLCAPQSGARTRKQIKKQARRGIEHIEDLKGDMRSQVDDWVRDVADTLEDGLNRGRRMTLAGREKLLGAFDDAKHYVDEGRTRIERLIGVED